MTECVFFCSLERAPISGLAAMRPCHWGLFAASPAPVAGVTSTGSGAVYAMTKAAMVQLTKTLACEWGPADGIRVNCVAPWMTSTPLLEAAIKDDPSKMDKVSSTTESQAAFFCHILPGPNPIRPIKFQFGVLGIQTLRHCAMGLPCAAVSHFTISAPRWFPRSTSTELRPT